MEICNSGRGTTLASNCRIAKTFLTRFKGLMGMKDLERGSGLIIAPCNSIHMFFMKFPIDAVFLDKNNKVVYMVDNLKPWRVSKIVSGARSVLELPIGTIKSSGTQTGDQLIFK